MRLLLPLLAALSLAAPALAQGPVAVNGLIPRAHAAALPDAALFPVTFPGERGMAGGVEPDTTRPWRYFPLHPGDTWEYYRYNGALIERYVVTGVEVTYGGRRYVEVAAYSAVNGGAIQYEFTLPARFDTTASRVWTYYTTIGQEVPFYYGASFGAGCPLNAAFGSSVLCEGGMTDVSGGYDGRLTMGGALPGTGPDTLTVTYKRFLQPTFGIDERFVADVGFVYAFNGENGEEVGLTFARVAGVTYGTERYPGVGTGGAEPPVEGGRVALTVSPNPARGRAVVSFTVAEAGPVALALYDATGRRVRTAALGVRAAGRHEAALDLAGLAPGLYLARLTGPGGTVGRPVTVGG